MLMTPEKWQALRIADARRGLKWSYVLLCAWMAFIVVWLVLLLYNNISGWFGWFFPLILLINLISILTNITSCKRIIAGKESHTRNSKF